MVRSFLKKKFYFILILSLSFIFTTTVSSQNKKDKDTVELLAEIIVTYEEEGEQKLYELYKKKKKIITSRFIVAFARIGVRDKEEEWLKITLLLARWTKEPRTLADVYLHMGEYFRLIPDNKKATNYFDKALPLYQKLNDPVGQGNVYRGKGSIFLNKGDYINAHKQLNTALVFFKKTGNSLGQGSVYLRKGQVFFNTGDKSKALEMYDKALIFFEKADMLLGQGNVYEGKGDILFNTGEDSEAIKMYDKALFFYEKEGALSDQGNIYLSKGDIYSNNGDNSRAFEMYNKALITYEKAGDKYGQEIAHQRKGDFYTKIDENAKTIEEEKGNDDKDKKLREEIHAVYKSKGKEGLRNYIKKNKDNITNKIILDFAILGNGNRNEEWLRISEIMAEEKKDEKILAEVYILIGGYFGFILDYKTANDYYEKSLLLCQKTNYLSVQGRVYHSKGVIFFYKGYYEKALAMYEKALYFSIKANDFIGQGNVYLSMGNILLKSNELAKAIDFYDKALHFYEKGEDSIGQGNVYHEKGGVYLRAGENDRALEMYNKALNYYEITGEPLSLGNVYRSIGAVYLNTGEYSKGIEMYDKAFDFYESAKDLIGQGYWYSIYSKLFLEIGDILNALELNDKAIQLFKKVGDLMSQGNGYHERGEIYFFIGDYSKALDMYDKAQSFYKKTGDLIGMGNVCFRKGNIYYFRGDYQRALNMYDKSLTFYDKAGFLLNHGHIYLSKGDIYLFYIEDNSSTLEMYDKALYFFEKVEDIQGQGSVYTRKGDFYFYIGENSKSLEMYDKALLLPKGPGSIESNSFTLHGKAKVLLQLCEKEKALELFEKGIAFLEKVRKSTPFSEMKKNYMRTVCNQYEETVFFMLENDYYENGFKYAEKMRARVFLERLAEGMEKLNKGLSPELKQRRDKLVFRLAAIKKDITYEIKKKNKNQRKLDELNKELNKIEIELDNLFLEILQKNPQYASLYREPVELKNLRQKILKKDELLLEYFLSEDGVYIFLVSREDFKVKKLEADKKKIDDAVNKYLDFVSPSQPIESRSNKNKRIKHLENLYSFLIKPVEKEIKGKKLIISPDGQLAKIPFEALVSNRNRRTGTTVFLIEKYPIKYIQSASVLSYLRSGHKREEINDNLVAFGDPVYDYDNFKMSKPEKGSRFRSLKEEDELKDIYRSRYIRGGGTFDRLTGSNEEVRTIAELFEKKGQKTVIYLREKATEKNAKSPTMNRVGYIHFGCHGEAGDEFQSLVLSQDIPGETEDGFFSFDEIMNCDYNAQLIVLSACKTSLGKAVKGEGVIGLTRAVMYAGTPAVVASLWKVKDTATKELMVRFYKNLLEKGLEKSEALRQAKLELLKTKKYVSPIFWSAFIMYGE